MMDHCGMTVCYEPKEGTVAKGRTISFSGGIEVWVRHFFLIIPQSLLYFPVTESRKLYFTFLCIFFTITGFLFGKNFHTLETKIIKGQIRSLSKATHASVFLTWKSLIP